MRGITFLKIVIFFCFVILVSCAYGTTTNTWTQSSESDFTKGTTQNVSTYSTGEVRLSQKMEIITGISSTFVWTMTSDLKDQVFVGTGDPGTVYLIKSNSEAVEIFKTPEIYVQSVTTDKYGNLYVGTAPKGIIYKINTKNEVSVFCELPAIYIWDMVVDSDSNLFVATGNGGVLYKITSNGVPAIFFDSPEANLLCLLLDQFNNIYIGTEPDGVIYKVTPAGQAYVLYDASEGEIHCLAMDSSGNIYAGTASGVQAQILTAPSGQPLTQTGVTTSIFKEEKTWDLNIPEELLLAQPAPLYQPKTYTKDADTAQKVTGIPMVPNCVYKILQDGIVQKIFEVSQALILGMSIDTQDNLYVVTGNKSGVYKIIKDNISGNLINPEETQVLCCHNTINDELYIGTGNTGKVYKISTSYEKEGVFVSSVLDTATQSDWGCIYWEETLLEETEIKLFTRSGNCGKPDKTWNDWSVPYLLSGEKIMSPPARFIQYKAILQTTDSDKTPVLETVSVTYVSKNQPPKIVNFAVEKETSGTPQKLPEAKTNGKAESKPQTPTSLKPHHQMAQKSIQWETEDTNNDSLQLTILYKGLDEKMWKIIDKNTQKKGNYTWDTLRIPDGKYEVKLLVSDIPDNPPEIAFNVENVIQNILVDNSRPVIESVSAAAGTDNKFIITGRIKDKHSNVIKVQYTIDGQEWISAYPVDGIFDSLDESFQITTKSLTSGDYTIIINAFDTEGNVGIEKVVFEIK